MNEEDINKLADAIKLNVAICQKEVLTVDEAALYTGLSKSTLYKLTSGRLVPHSKPSGKNCFFRRKDLEEWMMSEPVATIVDLNSAAIAYCMRNKTFLGRPIKKIK